MYHPPVGVWRTSRDRMMLWAVEQVLHKAKQRGEANEIRKWQGRIEKALTDPVKKYDWKSWYSRNVAGDGEIIRADENPPAGSDHWWDALPARITKDLWKQAATMRTSAEGLPFDPEDLEAGIGSALAQVKGISETMKEQLRRIMRLALREGEGPEGFASRLQQEWALLSKDRAELIARTEWNRAASHATWRGLLKAGVTKKVWFTAGDNRVCPICEQNSADGEIPVNAEFYSGDQFPPAHPGCRCNISGAGG